MKSILSFAAVALLRFSDVVVARSNYPAAALVYRQYGALVYQGCYSSADTMTLNETYIYQSSGHCKQQCVPMNKPVQAQTQGTQCYCGDEVPPASAKVDDSKCSSICAGYKYEKCGADGFFTVYLDGITQDVPNAVGSSSSTTASASSTPKTSSTTSSTPSVVTVEGQTVVVTAPPSGSAKGGSSKSSGGGSNKTAIAAGVVVGIVIIAALSGGVFLYVRHRRRRAIEEEHRRTAAVSSFIDGSKSPQSSGGTSSLTDTRLDPVMANRRFSDGSIADNQDYSRRILKVTNA